MDKIGIIGVPQDLGASRRGVDMGPSAIRIAGLHKKLIQLGYDVHDYGNLHCHDIDQYTDIDQPLNKSLRYLKYVVEMCGHLKEAVQIALEDQCFPLILGGDHSISIGTMAGLCHLHNGKTGLIWIDAHGDFNTHHTTLSGNIHGMSLAVIVNKGHKILTSIGPSPTAMELNTVLIGSRDLDFNEARLLRDSQITVYSMRELDELGMSSLARKAIDIATNGLEYIHVSLDIDSLDPTEAPGTGTRVPGGLTYREAHLLMEIIHESGKLASLELVEVNPTLDIENKTAKLAMGLIASALGSKII